MTRIAIANMTCGGCAKGVAATLREATPGAEVRVDLERREVTVESEADSADLLTVLGESGWEAELRTA